METNNIRITKISNAIKKIISLTLMSDIRDPRLKNIMIDFVKLSNDLSLAKIYFSLHTTKNSLLVQKCDSLIVSKLLNKASGFFRKAITKNLFLRKYPIIRFYQDDSLYKIKK